MIYSSIEVKGFLETSFLDWPGKVAAVIFLPGCNFRCPYCHNHPLVPCPQEIPTIPWTTSSPDWGSFGAGSTASW